MATNNRNLRQAKLNKNDEFYTQLKDIAEELEYYSTHFQGKTVLCDCDEPTSSNFVAYFRQNFQRLGLHCLIATSTTGTLYRYWGRGSEVRNLPPDSLYPSGDFRSAACLSVLKEEADIVVTNPPFSLFRPYMQRLFDYEKKFIILGNQNAATFNSIFKQIQLNKMWFGVKNGGNKWFKVPEDYSILTKSRQKIVDGVKYFSLSNTVWYTNLDHPNRYKSLPIECSYNKNDYPQYENFDAVEVSSVVKIPKDYTGNMGVPVTFLYKYNPLQFSLVDYLNRPFLDGRPIYKRIIIRNIL